jgi:hypothetical protein
MQEGYLDKEVPERKVLEVTESKLVGLLEVRPTQGPNWKHTQMNKVCMCVCVRERERESEISKMTRRIKYIIGDVCGNFCEVVSLVSNSVDYYWCYGVL